jgi:hypothetical protein
VKEAGWNQKHHALEADQARLWILEKFHLGLGQDARSFAGWFLSWTSGTSTCATRRQSPTPGTWKLRSRTAAAQGPCIPQVAPGKSHRGLRKSCNLIYDLRQTRPLARDPKWIQMVWRLCWSLMMFDVWT